MEGINSVLNEPATKISWVSNSSPSKDKSHSNENVISNIKSLKSVSDLNLNNDSQLSENPIGIGLKYGMGLAFFSTHDFPELGMRGKKVELEYFSFLGIETGLVLDYKNKIRLELTGLIRCYPNRYSFFPLEWESSETEPLQWGGSAGFEENWQTQLEFKYPYPYLISADFIYSLKTSNSSYLDIGIGVRRLYFKLEFEAQYSRKYYGGEEGERERFSTVENGLGMLKSAFIRYRLEKIEEKSRFGAYFKAGINSGTIELENFSSLGHLFGLELGIVGYYLWDF